MLVAVASMKFELCRVSYMRTLGLTVLDVGVVQWHLRFLLAQ